MKKIFIASALVLFSAVATFAQQNTILLYGNLGLQSDKDASDDGLKDNTVEFKPGIGYQFNENWTVGLNLGITSRKTEVIDDEFTKFNQFEVGPFLRYTQFMGDIFRVFGQLDLGFQTAKNDPPGDDNEVKATGFVGRVFPAVAVNVKNNFCLNFSFGGLSFESAKVEDADNSSTSLKLNFGQQFNFGISKNFGRK